MSTNTYIKEDLMQEQILQAAKQLFQVHGLRKVTMDDVAKAIGKGRSSLYYYYKSKEEILYAVIDAEIREMLTAMALAIDKAPTAEKKLYAFCHTKFSVLQERRAFYNAIDAGMDADEISNYNKVKLAIHDRIMKQEGILLSQILNFGIEKGELRAMDKDEQDTLIFVLLSSVHGLKREIVIENNFSGLNVLVDTLTRMVIYGVRK